MKLLVLPGETVSLENPFENAAEAADQEIDQEVCETVVIFLHAEAADSEGERNAVGYASDSQAY